MSNNHWDVIIVGSGAGGGTLAHRLASTGKRILVLERGQFLPREPENWNEDEVVTRGRYRTKERWLDGAGEPFEPFTHDCVGGNTKMFGAALFRLREHDFMAKRLFDGVTPAWPISYADLEPYYGQAERLYHVHGHAGIDPTEPPRAAGFAHAALVDEPRIAALKAGFAQIGLHPFPMPIGIRLPDDLTRQAPVSLAAFDGFPDPTESKADAHVISVAGALRFPNVTLRTGALAEQLLTNAHGTEVTGVVVRSEQGEETLRADVVVLACGAIQSAALLLRSRTAVHSEGLANGSGQVGRNYMAHNNGALIAYSPRPNDARFQKTFAITDFYRGAPDSDYPLGSIQLMGKSDRPTLRALFGALLPDADDAHLSAHTVDFWLSAEDLPLPENRVQLTRDGQIQLVHRRTNNEAYERLRLHLERAIQQAEPEQQHLFAGYRLGISGVSHQCGTLRFGHDPATSVLDVNCRAHQIDNLYVVDASFFCSSGALNPSLTIMANALRVGDHLADRLL